MTIIYDYLLHLAFSILSLWLSSQCGPYIAVPSIETVRNEFLV